MMKADWDMTPVKGGSGNAFLGKVIRNAFLLKKRQSIFAEYLS